MSRLDVNCNNWTNSSILKVQSKQPCSIKVSEHKLPFTVKKASCIETALEHGYFYNTLVFLTSLNCCNWNQTFSLTQKKFWLQVSLESLEVTFLAYCVGNWLRTNLILKWIGVDLSIYNVWVKLSYKKMEITHVSLNKSSKWLILSRNISWDIMGQMFIEFWLSLSSFEKKSLAAFMILSSRNLKSTLDCFLQFNQCSGLSIMYFSDSLLDSLQHAYPSSWTWLR